MSNVVDIETGQAINDSGQSYVSTAVDALLDEVRELNQQGRVQAMMIVVVDDCFAPRSLTMIPDRLPPNIYIGALEVAKHTLLSSVVGSMVDDTGEA